MNRHRFCLTFLAVALAFTQTRAQDDPLSKAEGLLKEAKPFRLVDLTVAELQTLSPEEQKLVGSWSAGSFGLYKSRKMELRPDRSGLNVIIVDNGTRIEKREDLLLFGMENGELWIADRFSRKKNVTLKEYQGRLYFEYGTNEIYFKGRHPND